MSKHASVIKLVGAAILSVIISSSLAQSMTVESQKVVKQGSVTKVRMEVEVPRASGGSGKASKLDILFVVDDSGSMGPHQQNLLRNVDNLVNAAKASGVDIHAGVINTNIDTQPWGTDAGKSWKGELAGVSKKFAATADGDFVAILTENLKAAMHTQGSGQEQPFAAIQLALSEPLKSGVNKDFLRDGAALALFVLTDADDQSPITVPDFVQFLKTVKSSAPISMHAAYVPVADKTCDRSGEPESVRLEEVLKAFGTVGESVGLCDADYSTKLMKIGEGFEAAGLDVVQLKMAPVVSTIRATYGTEVFDAGDLSYGWTYNTKKMQMLFGSEINWVAQPKGTPLVIEYSAK